MLRMSYSLIGVMMLILVVALFSVGGYAYQIGGKAIHCRSSINKGVSSSHGSGYGRKNLHQLHATTEQKVGPRKELFFEIVESGLEDRFSREEIPRVFKFCDYCTQKEPAPVGYKTDHDICEEFIDGLTANPWWDTDKFSWVKKLEERSEEIATELNDVLRQQELFIGDSRYMNVMGEGWTAFRLQRLGEWNKQNVKLFSKTTEILQGLDIPFAVRGVMFAKQAPGSGVQPHSDGRNFILTAHLGLQIPDPKEQCWIKVASEQKNWDKGKVIILDTSFTHSTANDAESDRYVLIVDFWHPELTPQEMKALEFVYDTRNKFETGKAQDIDCSYVKSGKPTELDAYIKGKETFGSKFASFFTGGGLVKFK